jgi:hypothetical protein
MEQWSVGVRDFPAEFTADHGRGLGGVGRVKIESLVPFLSRIFLLLGPLAREIPCSACRVGKFDRIGFWHLCLELRTEHWIIIWSGSCIYRFKSMSDSWKLCWLGAILHRPPGIVHTIPSRLGVGMAAL